MEILRLHLSDMLSSLPAWLALGPFVTTALAGLATLAVAYCYLCSDHLHIRWQLRNVPGPPSRLLLGNLPDIGRQSLPECHVDWYQKYGPVFKYRVGMVTHLTIGDPTLVGHIGVKQFKSFHDRPLPPMLPPEARRGILFGQGAYWAGVRSAVTPLFHTSRLSGFGHIMHRAADRLLQRLQSRAPNQSFEIVNVLQGMTLEVIGSAAFGVEIVAQEDQAGASSNTAGLLTRVLDAHLRAMTNFRASTFLTIICPPLRGSALSIFQRIPGTEDCKAKERLSWMKTAVGSLLKGASSSPSGDITEQSSFLKQMLNAAKEKNTQRPLTPLEIQTLCMNFIAAGTETTATTLAFAVYLIAQHPEVEAKLVAEIDQYYSLAKEGVGSEEGPSYEELAQFSYTEQVVWETLRLYPVAPAVTRETTETCQVASTGLTVPKGTTVIIPIFAMHRDPAVFPNPSSFCPERFAKDSPEAAKRHQYGFLPFGVGPHMCIGYRFAMEEAKLALIKLYRRVRFDLDLNKVEMKDGEIAFYQAGLVLKPKSGIHVFVHPR